MQLIPQHDFTVVRQIADHLDTSTYYVRAVIRNAYTDEIITTLDLTDKGSQRFKKNWIVSPDTSGEGFFISIVTSVYTDSGYTTKSPNYGDEENTYLVKLMSKTGGGGGGVDYYTIKEIIKKEISKIPAPEKPEKINIPKYEMRWDEILEKIKNIPQPKETDLNPVLKEIQEVLISIQNKEVTPATDIEPIKKEIGTLKLQIENFEKKNDSKIKILADKVNTTIKENINNSFKDVSFTVKREEITKNKQEPIKNDINIKKLSI